MQKIVLANMAIFKTDNLRNLFFVTLQFYITLIYNTEVLFIWVQLLRDQYEIHVTRETTKNIHWFSKGD